MIAVFDEGLANVLLLNPGIAVDSTVPMLPSTSWIM
jgi:hypothetical protein